MTVAEDRDKIERIKKGMRISRLEEDTPIKFQQWSGDATLGRSNRITSTIGREYAGLDRMKTKVRKILQETMNVED